MHESRPEYGNYPDFTLQSPDDCHSDNAEAVRAASAAAPDKGRPVPTVTGLPFRNSSCGGSSTETADRNGDADPCGFSPPGRRNHAGCGGQACSDSGANPAQQEAIAHFEGPCEVIAGPGSGKTFVIVRRILSLIRDRGISPAHILVLTFSRAAAEEMRRRFDDMSRPEHYEVVFGTFHSVFYRILQTSSGRRDQLISERQRRDLLDSLIRRHLRRPPGPEETGTLASLIARTEATGRYPLEGSPDAVENFRRIFADYRCYLKENHLIDFEDMISGCLALLKSDPALLTRWQERFRYLLIDEFQDLNAGQFEICRLLAGKRRNLFVVGDDDQSIYGFRGSDPSYMMEFPNCYPGTHQITLDVNYRCGSGIVCQSQAVIRENHLRIDKEIRSFRRTEHDVRLMEYQTMEEEYTWLCGKLRSGEEAADSSAIIVRTHTQMRGLVRFLQKEKIACREWSGSDKSSGHRPDPEAVQEFDLVLGYWRLADDLDQDRIRRGNLFRILNHPERWLLRRDFRQEWYTRKELIGLFPPESRENLQLQTLCRDLETLHRLSPAMALRYLQRVVGLPLQNEDLQKALETLAGSHTDFYSMLGALESADLQKLLAGTHRDPEQGVRLLTMHACKGLEFDTVYLPDLNEGILPNRRAQTEQALEEERRLFYVAMTRARNELNLLYLRGDRNNPRRPSRFLHPLGVKDWQE